MRVRSLGQEDPLEEGMATHSSTLAWRIPWKRSLVGYIPRGRKESDMTESIKHACRQSEIKHNGNIKLPGSSLFSTPKASFIIYIRSQYKHHGRGKH